VPEAITAGGKPILRVSGQETEGYLFDEKTHVLRIHHESARDVDIRGQGDGAPLKFLRFDNPHLSAQTALETQYASGLIDWGRDAWMIHVPEGKFGTFCLSLKDPKQTHGSFAFPIPVIFAGIDAYNGGARAATIRLRSPQQREQRYTLAPGELRVIRTGWHDPGSRIEWEFEDGEGLLFDNLAYRD
jgi:hypothetical protein